jgi:hypothetical protein
MSLRLKVFPYKLGSASAKSLAQALGVKRVRPTYDARRNDVIINWGNSTPPHFKSHSLDLNKPEAIALACNKLKTFQALSNAGFTDLPIWSDSRYDIYNLWAGYPDRNVYCRTSLTGHSGSGIVIASNSYELVDAPLYTIQTKHKHEYRVHVFKGEVIDVQQKKRKLGSGASGTGIRNHANGWIYARCDIDVPSRVLEASVTAVGILGLDFGAVDIGYREIDGRVFLFEVNTAPGLYSTTLQSYVDTFNNYLEEIDS